MSWCLSVPAKKTKFSCKTIALHLVCGEGRGINRLSAERRITATAKASANDCSFSLLASWKCPFLYARRGPLCNTAFSLNTKKKRTTLNSDSLNQDT